MSIFALRVTNDAYVAAALSSIDDRLPRAILRCAFTACQRPRRDWRVKDEEYAASAERRREEIKEGRGGRARLVEQEGNEPEWPAFELEHPHARHHFGPGKWQEEREKAAGTHPQTRVLTSPGAKLAAPQIQGKGFLPLSAFGDS